MLEGDDFVLMLAGMATYQRVAVLVCRRWFVMTFSAQTSIVTSMEFGEV